MSPTGLALSLGALACEAAFSLLAVPLLATLGPVGVFTCACAAAAAMLLAGAVGVSGSDAVGLPTRQEAAAFGYLAVVVPALGFVVWYSGVRRLGVERAGLFAGVVPVAAFVTSAAVGAAATLPRLVGAVAVGAGVTLGMSGRPAGWPAKRPRSMAYRVMSAPSRGQLPWKRKPHCSITRRAAAWVNHAALMIRASPTISTP